MSRAITSAFKVTRFHRALEASVKEPIYVDVT